MYGLSMNACTDPPSVAAAVRPLDPMMRMSGFIFRSATIVVIVFTVAVSLVIWLMDSTVRFVVNQILRMFGAA